jgi:methyl-accepting chemotaxis protein
MKLPFIRNNEKQKEFQDLFRKIENLLNSARKLFTQSEEVKKIVANEKEAVEKSSTAALEIESMVATTARAAQELSQTAISSNGLVEDANRSLEKMTELISTVNQTSNRLQISVAEGLKEISSVTQTMQEIREKAKIINEIVFQTKLLSFNASVEAARAGEHGKGFAVVADEMGKLARASGLAAKEIEEILATSVQRTNAQIQKVTAELETVSSDTVNAISDVSAKSTEISDSFSRLYEFSKNTEFQSQEISKATKEQEVGVSQISQALQDLEISSQKLDGMAVESYQNSSDLGASVENINVQFLRLAAGLGYEIAKVESIFDFDAAISAHVDWKMKLSKYLGNPDGSLDHKKVCLDNACILGKWLYGEGTEYKDADPKIYESLRMSHADFHKTAGEIILLINSNELNQAKVMLQPGGPYMKVSDKTVSLIRELMSSVELKKSA